LPRILHFTHGRNLSAILNAGELRSHSAAQTVADIADASIKSRRTTIAVGCGPGGVVGDYVPFYFAPRSPMLYRLEREHGEGKGDGQRALIYISADSERMVEAGLPCVFSDGNAAHHLTQFSADLGRMGATVDWELMAAVLWANTPEDGDRVRRRQAEFLVHGAVPLDLIVELAVIDQTVRLKVEELLAGAGRALPVVVRPDWYF
jgi:ssDNA thymidine ADP-ribosyltransferase, DarT